MRSPTASPQKIFDLSPVASRKHNKSGLKKRVQNKALAGAAVNHVAISQQAHTAGILVRDPISEPIAQLTCSPKKPGVARKNNMPASETVGHQGMIHPGRLRQLESILLPSILGKRRHEDSGDEDDDDKNRDIDSSSIGTKKSVPTSHLIDITIKADRLSIGVMTKHLRQHPQVNKVR